MTPGHVRFEYLQRAGMFPPYNVYQQSLDPNNSQVPRGVRSLIPALTSHPDIQPGELFNYQNINVDVIGWLIEAIAEQPLQEFLREHVWRELQTEHDAFMPTDPNFTALAAGGFSSTARDAARFGLAVLNDGQLGQEQIFPIAWIKDTYRYSDNDASAFAQREPSSSDFSAYGSVIAYRNYWYIHDQEQGAMATRGYGGQSIYINKASNVVIITFASGLAENRQASNVLMYLSHELAKGL